MNKKAYRLVGLVFLVLTLVALPGIASAAMWVGVEIGGNFVASTDIKLTANNFGGSATIRNASINPSVIGGITIGYDFVKEGFGGYNYPNWMKYFGILTDFTYNRVDFPGQVRTVTAGGFTFNNVNIPRFEGYAAVWTFMLYAHYGFLADSDVPAGRLHPYLGVGPGIVFSGIDSGDLGLGNRSSTNIALVTEAGLRFFALRNVSLDAAFRYRWTEPTYSFTGGSANVTLNQFSVLFRTSYHF